MHCRRIKALVLGIVVAALIFVACAFGITTQYQKLALLVGNVLVLLFTGGMFYATLHLQKKVR